jgi:hypothetical protein
MKLAVGVACLIALSACEFSLSPSVPGNIALQPASADVEPGELTEHRIFVLDQRGDAMSAEWPTQVEWEVDPERAELEVVGDRLLVTPRVKGSLSIWGELGNVRRNFEFWVHPPGLARIELDHPEPLIVGARYRRIFLPRLYHEDGDEMARSDFRLSYEVADTTLATVINQNPSILIWGNAILAPDDFEPRAGTTTLRVTASGTSQEFDLIVTLEPTPVTGPPSVEPVSASELLVSWQGVTDADDGYELEAASDRAGPWMLLARTGSNYHIPSRDTTYHHGDLATGSTHYYRVRGCNSQGCALEYSPVGEGTVGGPA